MLAALSALCLSRTTTPSWWARSSSCCSTPCSRTRCRPSSPTWRHIVNIPSVTNNYLYLTCSIPPHTHTSPCLLPPAQGTQWNQLTASKRLGMNSDSRHRLTSDSMAEKRFRTCWLLAMASTSDWISSKLDGSCLFSTKVRIDATIIRALVGSILAQDEVWVGAGLGAALH